MRDWCLSKVIWVADRGFSSAENRRYLRKGGGSYIIGEKLRSGSADAQAALSRQGRYKDVAGNLKVKEVRISDEERFVICFNPEAAERDAAVRGRMIARLEETIRDSDQLSRDKRAELRGVISTRPGMNRYLRVTPGGLLRTDAAKAKAEENLDGKYLLRTADPKLPAEDIALDYKQLLEVERGYILLGMIIQKVTGQSPGTEISRRILTPLGLRGTSFPLTSTQITAPYAHGYYGPIDVTHAANPSNEWTAGAMISTVDDVARFYRALLTGRLLPPAQQRELMNTIPVNDTGELFAEHYGLGIYSVQLSCGTAWGHDGGAPQGYKTIAYTSQDGSRQAVMIYNSYTMSFTPPGGTETAAFERDQRNALDIAFCGQR